MDHVRWRNYNKKNLPCKIPVRILGSVRMRAKPWTVRIYSSRMFESSQEEVAMRSTRSGMAILGTPPANAGEPLFEVGRVQK